MAASSAPILVTGGAGYIGSHTVLALRDAGRSVVVIDDLSTGLRGLVPQEIPFHQGNVADRRFVDELLARYRPSAVLHFAGSIISEESVSEPVKYYLNNTAASLNLIESCRAVGIENFIFSSTAAVYGASSVASLPEDAPTDPASPYGRSKLMTERILADVAATSSLRYAALRYFNVAGADPAGRAGPCTGTPTHLMRLAALAVVGSRDAVAIFGTDYDTPDGTCIRDYVHVSDLAAAHVAALDRLIFDRRNFTLNIGYGHGFSVREVLAKFRALGRADLAIREGLRRPGDVPVLIADNRRALAELSWKPRYDDLDFIVKTALDWERKMFEAGS